MSLPSFKKLFQTKSEVSALAQLSEIQTELEALNETHKTALKEKEWDLGVIDSLTSSLENSQEEVETLKEQLCEKGLELAKSIEENERLRTRLARVGLELSKLKTEQAKLTAPEQPPIDIVDTLESDFETGAIELLVNTFPEEGLSTKYQGKSAGYLSNQIIEKVKARKNGKQVFDLIDAITDVQYGRLCSFFDSTYINFHSDYYNSMALYSTVCEMEQDKDEVCKLISKMSKALDSRAALAQAIFRMVPQDGKSQKTSERTLSAYKEIITYVGENLNVSLSKEALCKSFGVSIFTIERYVYLTMLVIDSKNLADWRKEL